MFDHWLIWDIAPDSKGFAEGGEKRGINAGGQPGFFAACPPDKAHRYFFKLFALDTKLGGATIRNKADLQAAMAGHIIGQAEMIGIYGPATSAGGGADFRGKRVVSVASGSSRASSMTC